MSTLVMSVSQGRPGVRRKRNFTFNKGDLVLVKWADGMVYFAKIKHVYHRREKCVVVFDDKSQDEADFSQIHSVDETTTDIICIKCKKDDSDLPNEIVLCDKCGIGFHQKCHNPIIPASALQLDSPWNCSYCQRGAKCPYLTESLDVLQNLLSDDNESVNGDEECNGIEPEGGDNMVLEDSGGMNSDGIKKRKSLRTEAKRCSTGSDKKKNLRGSTPTAVSSLVTTEKKSLPAEKPENDSPNHKDLSFSEEDDSKVVESVSASRKRKKYTPLHHKRQKRPSVESHTVSVTRLDSPIFADGFNMVFSLNGKQDDSITSPLKSKHEKRSLRVSLSLPDEMEKRRYLKSPFSCNGDSAIRSDSVSPTTETMKVSPSCDINNPVTGFSDEMENQANGAFTATALPAVTSEIQNDPSSSSEIVSPVMDVGVTSTSERPSNVVVTNSVVISSCKSPPAEMPADSSTAGRCLTGMASPSMTCSKTTDPNVNADDLAPSTEKGLGVNSENCMEGNSITVPAASGNADNADAAVIPVPTTLPVVIERSMCYPNNNDGLVSPTKAIISIGNYACEAGDSSCAQLTPVSTSTSTYLISGCDEGMSECETSETITESANYVDRESQDEPNGVEKDSMTQDISDEPKDSIPVSLQESDIENNSGSTTPTAGLHKSMPFPTSVITGSLSTSKPQSHSRQSASGNGSQMSKLDRELAAVIGYEEELEESEGKSEEKNKDIVNQTVEQVSSNENDISTTKAGLLESKPEEVGGKAMQTTEESESTEISECANGVDPDVIITSVEPSKESTRRDSASVKPSGWDAGHMSGSGTRPSLHLNQTATEVSVDPGCGDKNKLPAYPVHSTETPGVKSPTQSGSVHAAHAIYSPGSRIPMGYQSRGSSVIYTPNGPMYYAPVQQNGSLPKQGSAPSFPAGVATSKPYAIVNGVSASSADGSIPRGVEGGRHYVIYKDGICQQVIPQCTYMVPPDSTAEAESPAGSLGTCTTTTSSSEEKDKLPRRKFAQKDIQYIQKKVGDACNSYDVSMFMAAFNDAWQKFQANAMNYQDQAVAMNSKFALGQAADGSQQVHLVSSKPRVVAPKLSSSATESGANSIASPTFVHAPPTSTQKQQQQQQQQYFLQHVASNPHYASVYAVPGASHPHTASSAKAGCIPQASVSNSVPHTQSEKPKPSVTQSKPTPPLSASNKAAMMSMNHFKTRQTVQPKLPSGSAKPGPLPIKKQQGKICSRCGKLATYICSGCRKEWYCGRECQLADWARHSKHCKM